MPIRAYLRVPLGAGPSLRIGSEAAGEVEEAGFPREHQTERGVHRPKHPSHTILSCRAPRALPSDGDSVVLRVIERSQVRLRTHW